MPSKSRGNTRYELCTCVLAPFRCPESSYVSTTHRFSSEEDKATATVGTASLLSYLAVAYPETAFYFCLGADAYTDLMAGKWKESDRVLQILEGRLVVFHREGDGVTTTASSPQGANVSWCKVNHLGNVSSSQVRECRDLETLKTLVMPEVLQYMRENQLYSFSHLSV